MFTGIIEALRPVVEVSDHDGIRMLTVDLDANASGLEPGASVAVNGVCLTVVSVADGRVRFDVIGETLGLTNLGCFEAGDLVDIERSLRFGDEIGGHLVSGHVAGTVEVVDVVVAEANRTVWFSIDPVHLPFLLWKGWVAIDGVSLTVSRLDRENARFAVSLIPETVERTTLGTLGVGGRANLELDSQTQAIVQTVRDILGDTELSDEILDRGRQAKEQGWP